MQAGRLWPAVPPYQRAKPIYLPSNATDASRGRQASGVFRNPRKALHLERMPSAYTPNEKKMELGQNLLKISLNYRSTLRGQFFGFAGGFALVHHL